MASAPTVEGLLERHAGVRHRERTRPLDREVFDRLQRRVRSGLEWGVGAVVTDDDGRVLLIRERDRWSVPGGGVEPGESLQEALRRELREETGVRVSVDELCAVTEQTAVHGDRETQFGFATYTATPETTDVATQPGLDGEGIETAEWVDRLPENTLDRELVAALRDV